MIHIEDLHVLILMCSQMSSQLIQVIGLSNHYRYFEVMNIYKHQLLNTYNDGSCLHKQLFMGGRSYVVRR
jgi:hypothetical protein